MQYRLIIGNQAYSSWSLRGWLLLRAFGIEFDCEIVQLRTQEFDRFVQDNFPARTVPALQVTDGDQSMIIWDSFAIAEFLHERHPHAGIWPDDPAARAAARSVSAEMHSGFDALRGTMPMNVRRQYKNFSPDADAQFDINRIESLWDWAGDRRGKNGAYLFGEKYCAADAFFTPVASRFRTYGIPLNANSQLYVEALLQHPATVEFYRAGFEESWIMAENEFENLT